MKINLKSENDLIKMTKGGEILTDVIKKTLKIAKSGMSTMDLENFAAKLIKESGALPSFKTVDNYRFATCMCVNDCVVHGLPSGYKLKKGDILGLDCGVIYQGLHTDASWSVIIDDDNSPEFESKRRLLAVGKKALNLAIQVAKPGNYIWDIGETIEKIVEKEGGYHVVHVLTGHGIGSELHEDPFIPGYPEGKREKSVKITPGMALAIEIIYGEKTGKVCYRGDDDWSIVTADGSDSGLFEETVFITSKGPVILTHLA